MIKAKELMLGNYVTYLDEPMYVTGIFSDTVYLNFEGNEGDVFEIEEESLAGIPITEELLEKCGFSTSVYGRYNRIWKRSDVLIEFERSRKWVLCHWGQRIENIDYLHELQNACFMLTKKELEVKL